MYRSFFGFAKRPFILTPDPDFLYLSRAHDLALTHLEYGLAHQVGFVALTGEVGAGKTSLLKYLFHRVHAHLDIALIFNTNLDPLSLRQTLCREFALTPASPARTDLCDALFRHFMARYSAGERCVIVVDEAQNLPLETFEELRMLSNLEADTDFLVQIVLAGQPQLRDRLADPQLAQLAQRISVHYHLPPLDNGEVNAYIEHRLKVAGYTRSGPLFEAPAVAAITAASGGIPRLINTICDAALTYAYAEERNTIEADLIDQVLADNTLIGSGPALHPLAPPQPPAPVVPGSRDGTSARIESLELRLQRLEAGLENRGAATVLQEMFGAERDRAARLEQQVAQLKNLCLALQAKLKKTEEAAHAEKARKPERRRWFGARSQSP